MYYNVYIYTLPKQEITPVENFKYDYLIVKNEF